MLLLLIDDQGEIWRGDSRELRAAFDSPYSGGEFIDYAVKNLGFIAINVFGASCQTRLRPDLVTERATFTLLDWIGNTRFERMVVSAFDKDWSNELVRMSDVPDRLAQMLTQGGRARPNDFLSRTLDASAIANRPLLRDIINGWPHIVDQFEFEALIAMLKGVFNDRLVVVKRSAEAPKMLFHEVGDGLLYSAYDTWKACAVGAPVEEQPDRHFGKWVARIYEDASTSKAPRIEAVDAIMRWPHAGRSRHRYKRLIFPFQSSDTPKFLIGGTIVDDTIDLRIAGN
ncbi:MAG: hypothetical protein AB7L90_03290 [Hyphomicrobiaceae bacterium]